MYRELGLALLHGHIGGVWSSVVSERLLSNWIKAINVGLNKGRVGWQSMALVLNLHRL